MEYIGSDPFFCVATKTIVYHTNMKIGEREFTPPHPLEVMLISVPATNVNKVDQVCPYENEAWIFLPVMAHTSYLANVELYMEKFILILQGGQHAH